MIDYGFTKSEWKTIINALDKLLDLEANQKRRVITAKASRLCNKLVNQIDRSTQQ